MVRHRESPARGPGDNGDESLHGERLARIETKMESVLDKLDDLVTRAEFLPVKVLTYGIASGVLSAFLGVLIFQVI